MQIINLDLQKKDGFNKAITARRGESGWQFGVRLFDGGLQYATTSGDKFAFKVTTPSGNYAKVDATYANGMVTVTLNSQITSEAGYYRKAYIEITNGTKIRTTQDIIFFSLGNSDISAGQAHYYVSELDKLLKQLNDEFDEWLVEREQDYADLLNRVNQLANRITGLDTKLDDIIAQLQKVEINTTNVLDTSLLTVPESNVRRRVDGQSFDVRSWGAAVFNNSATMQMFEPNKTYHTKYIAELLSLTGGNVTVTGHFGMCIYSGKEGFPTVWITQVTQPADVANMKVGDTLVMETTFEAPAELYNPEAGYQVLAYGRRDASGVVDAVRFHDVMIQEGSIFTGLQTNPDNTLTRFDEERLVKSILIDPKMTGTNPPTIEGGTGTPTTEVTYSSTGEMRIKNLSNGRARVYWTIQQLGLDFELSKQPFNVKLVARVTSNGSQIEVGYSGQTGNPIFNVTAMMDTYTATIKAEVNNAFCIYLQQGETLVIRELYIYPANTDITSKRIATIEDGLPEVKTMVTGTPDTLQNPDANTLTQSGRWKVYAGTNMPPLPVASGSYYWYFEVINFNPDNCLQRASLRYSGNPSTSNGNYEYTRQLVNSQWGTWQRFDLEATDGNNFSKTGVNLNDEKIGGRYIYINPTNAPKAGQTWYGNIQRYGGAFVMQTLYNVNGYDDMYVRKCANTTWQEWRKVAPELFSDGRVDTAAVDFNTLKETDTVVNTSATNSPDGATNTSWYTQIIRYGSSGNYVYQRATRISSLYQNTYERQLFNNTWTPWRLLDAPYIDQILGVESNANKITTTQNLQLEATTSANLPTSGSGIYYYLEVIARADNYVFQRATLRGGDMTTYTRQSHNGVWSPWVKVAKDDNSLPRVEITDFKTGWGHYSDNSRLTVRKVNGMVSLDGVFTNTVEMPNGADTNERIVATLPEGYRPDTIITGMRMNASGTTTWLLSIKPNGDICYSRHIDSGVSGWVGRQTVGKWFATHAVFPSA